MIVRTTADAVRDGLQRLVADSAWWPATNPAAFRNRLLDEGGGDSRPYVELIWRLHDLRIRERLERSADSAMERCRTVTRAIVAETLLDRDATQWGVESWALALGMLDARDVAPPPAQPTAAVPPVAATTTLPSRGARARGASPAAAPAAAPATPALPKRRWTIGTPGTPRSPLPKGPSPMAVAGLLAVMSGGLALVLLMGRVLRPTRAAVPSADTARVQPEQRTSLAPAMPSEPAVPTVPAVTGVPAVPSGVAAELHLRDGRTLHGIVDLVTPSDVFLHDAESGLPYGMPLVFVRDLRSPDGRVLWAPRVEDGADTTSVAAVDLRARGVGGEYRVTVRAASVDGDESCRAEPRWQAGRSWTERVRHGAMDDTASMPDRPGVRLHLAADGRFAAGPATGVSDATQWWFAMRGRFAPAGFTATTDLRTATTLKWRKVQRCRVRADLAAVRVR